MAQSLVAALGAKFPDSTVLCDDTFDHGPCGWTQLYSAGVPTGPLGMTSFPALRQRSLVLQTADQRSGALMSYPWGQATAIKRLQRHRNSGFGVVTAEFWWALLPMRGQLGMGSVEMGIDTADNNGVRRFYKLLWTGFDPAVGGGQYVSRWDILAQSGTVNILPNLNYADYTTNPATSFAIPYNEGKPSWVYCALQVNVATDKFMGVEIQGLGAGTLNPAGADTSLEGYGGTQSSLTTFANGLNPEISLYNRPDADSAQTLFLGRSRVSAQGAI